MVTIIVAVSYKGEGLGMIKLPASRSILRWANDTFANSGDKLGMYRFPTLTYRDMPRQWSLVSLGPKLET